MILEKIAKLNENLTVEKLFNRPNSDIRNRVLFQEICEDLIKEKTPNRKAISELIGNFEKLNEKSLAFLLDNFFKKFEIIKKGEITKIDKSVLDASFDKEAELMLEKIMENSLSQNNKLQISNYYVDFLDSTIEQQKEIFAQLVMVVQKIVGESSNLNDEDISNLHLFYTLARQFAIKLNLKHQFYLSTSAYIDKLTISEKNQFCRDIAEELLLASYLDDCEDAGHYLIFRAYSGQSSTIAAAVYLNIFIIALEKTKLYDFIFQGLVMETVKFLRNIKLIPLAINFYKNIPENTFTNLYQKLSLDNTFFTLLIHESPDNLPNLILEYLNKYREDILSFGENDIMPWLVTLYNIKAHFKERTNTDSLNLYINLFESIVPEESYINFKNAFSGTLESITQGVKNSLVSINKTRYKLDFVNDVKKIAVKARVLLEKSFKENNTYGFLLAMMVRSDYSFVLQDAEQTEDAVSMSFSKQEYFHEIYEHPVQLLLGLNLERDVKIFWLAADHNITYSLVFGDKTFSKIQRLNKFTYDALQNWKNKESDNLGFDDFKKSKNGNVIQLFKDDFLNQNLKIEGSLKFASININPKPKHLLIIKDIELSEFPHNLLLDKSDKFLYPQVAIASILSIEWLYQIKTKNKNLIENFTKEIWIPIENGDLDLNILFKKIEQKITELDFKIHTSPLPDKPISSNINIIAAHGDEDIASFNALFNNDKLSIQNLNYVVGDGDILIMLVCHSGSMNSDVYRNQVASLTRKFLEGKYQAVIAPYWALHIHIPEIWLSEFMIEIDKNEFIIDAVHKANLKVREIYPVAGAWACMHLYGNPYFRKE